MHWLAWVFIGTFFGISYRVSYKLISDQFSPLFNVSVISLCVSALCFLGFLMHDYHKTDLSGFNLKSLIAFLLIAIIVAGLEISIMMIYKSGGPLSVAQSLASAMIGCGAFAIGILYFKDSLNIGQIIGFVTSLIGICILTFSSR